MTMEQERDEARAELKIAEAKNEKLTGTLEEQKVVLKEIRRNRDGLHLRFLATEQADMLRDKIEEMDGKRRTAATKARMAEEVLEKVTKENGELKKELKEVKNTPIGELKATIESLEEQLKRRQIENSKLVIELEENQAEGEDLARYLATEQARVLRDQIEGIDDKRRLAAARARKAEADLDKVTAEMEELRKSLKTTAVSN